MGNEFVIQSRQPWKQTSADEWKQEETAKIISNPLVLLLAMHKIEHEEFVRNTLVDRFNYTICPSDTLSSDFYKKKCWSKKDIFKFVETSRYHLRSNAELQHDSVILYIAGYGNNGYVYTSDNQAIKLHDIQDKFGEAWKNSSRDIPKLCIFGCDMDSEEDTEFYDQMVYEINDIDHGYVSLSFYSNDNLLVTKALFSAIEAGQPINASQLINGMTVELGTNEVTLLPAPTIEMIKVRPDRCVVQIVLHCKNENIKCIQYQIKYMINDGIEYIEVERAENILDVLEADINENEVTIPNLLVGTKYSICARACYVYGCDSMEQKLFSNYGEPISIETPISARTQICNFANACLQVQFSRISCALVFFILAMAGILTVIIMLNFGKNKIEDINDMPHPKHRHGHGYWMLM